MTDEQDLGVFGYLKPTDEQLVVMSKFRRLFANLHDELKKDLPNGRYASLTFTALEEAAMWCNKSITRD